MFHRSLRGQVQPLAVLLAVGLLAVVLPYGLLERHTGSCMAELDALPEGSPLASLGVLAMMVLVLAGVWLGFRALTGLVRLIERGWLSELSLGSALCLVVIAATLVLGMAPEEAGDIQAWHMAAPLTWLAATFSLYALMLGKAPPAPAGPQLLVLRVFSQDSRRHTLPDAVQARWRYVDPVHQIGGADMVAMNVDPSCAA